MPSTGGRPRKLHPKTDAERARAYRRRQRERRLIQAIAGQFLQVTDVRETPQATFDALDAVFHFTCDVCADATNAKCPQYFTAEEDGLKQPWYGTCWMNPPYGDDLIRWVQHAFEASLHGATVVCLLPVRQETRWWQYFVRPLPRDCVYELPGRHQFRGQDRAPFPSAVVIFRPPC